MMETKTSELEKEVCVLHRLLSHALMAVADPSRITQIKAVVEKKYIDRKELSQVQRDTIRDLLNDTVIELETRHHKERHDEDTVQAVLHAMVDAIALIPVKVSECVL